MEVYLSVMEKSPASQNICAHKGLIGNVGCRHLVLRKKPMHLFFYVCPVNGRTVSQAHSCKGTGVFFFFCVDWGCETTGNVYWKHQRYLITVARNWTGPGLSSSSCKGNEHYFCLGFSCAKVVLSGSWTGVGSCVSFLCIPIMVKFTESWKKDRDDWLKGRTWGLWLYK